MEIASVRGRGGEGRAEGAMTIKMNHFSDRRQGTGRGGGGGGGITYACMRAMLQAGSLAKFLQIIEKGIA